jgi:hypothetical protein
MKTAFLSVLFLLSTSAASFANEAYTSAQDNWFCTADGFNSQNQRVSVSGEYKPTEEEAAQSALMTCRMSALSVCRVQSCFNLGW